MPFVHATAVIDDDVVLGDGTKVWHFVHVSSGARIGSNCVLGQNVFIGAKVTIGNGVRIQNNVSVFQGVEIEDDVFLGPSCVFTNVSNPRAFFEQKDAFKPTHVGKGASIGANATIVCGHRIGNYSFIGAGCVVIKDVPAYALLVGNPGRQLGWVCQCGQRLPDSAPYRCTSCNLQYTIEGTSCSICE